MRKLILAVLGVLFMAVGSHAQGTPYQLDPPAPNAILRACSFPVTGGNPCSNPTTIYSDSALTQAIAQPVQLGGSGNLIFYYSSGPLMLQLTGSVNRSILVAGGGGGGTPGGASHDVQCNIASAFAPCGSASGAFTSSGSLITRSETGTFTNTQANLYNAFVLNSCSASTEFSTEQGGNFQTDAVSGCAAAPNGATVHQVNGGGFYVNSDATGTNAVGVYSSARCLITNCHIWGSNPLADDGGFAASEMYGTEINVNVSNSSSQGQGIRLIGGWSAQPGADNTFATGGNFPAISILPNGNASTGSNTWTGGIYFAPGSLDGSAGGAAIIFAPNATGNNHSSQFEVFTSIDSGGTLHLGTWQETPGGVLQNANSPLGIKTFIVSGLPSASTVGSGATAIVTDASTFTVGACTGGGSDYMVAVSNGTTWSCH